ncbi:MAG: alkyl/aryl-sulfatase, partial [Sphingorhabdus sp.]|nr:alkyl/aryl-sulfatase [Sphingorhabdus sp.]
MKLLPFILLASASPLAAAAPGALEPKPASNATVEAQQAIAAQLPAEDGRDADFADRGFIATLADPVIRATDGKPIWNLAAYD